MNKGSRLKITTVQMNVSYKNKVENIAIVKRLLNEADSLGNIVLLPELFSTGYLFNKPSELQDLSESLDDSQTLRELQAIENSMFVFTCNRIGSEKTDTINGTYCGKSQAISPLGLSLMQCGSDTEVKTVEIDVDTKEDKKVIGVILEDEMTIITNNTVSL